MAEKGTTTQLIIVAVARMVDGRNVNIFAKKDRLPGILQRLSAVLDGLTIGHTYDKLNNRVEFTRLDGQEISAQGYTSISKARGNAVELIDDSYQH